MEAGQPSLVLRLAARLRAILNDVDEVSALLSETLEAMERAGQSLALATDGTSDDRVSQSIAFCAETAEGLVRSLQHIETAKSRLSDYSSTVCPGGAEHVRSSVSPTSPSSPGTAQPSFAPFVAAIAESLPVRERRGAPTDGVLTTTVRRRGRPPPYVRRLDRR